MSIEMVMSLMFSVVTVLLATLNLSLQRTIRRQRALLDEFQAVLGQSQRQVDDVLAGWQKTTDSLEQANALLIELQRAQP